MRSIFEAGLTREEVDDSCCDLASNIASALLVFCLIPAAADGSDDRADVTFSTSILSNLRVHFGFIARLLRVFPTKNACYFLEKEISFFFNNVKKNLIKARILNHLFFRQYFHSAALGLLQFS